MQREELIRGRFDRSMRLIELGPSYNPIVPKADGWQTTVIDHASQAELLVKYGTMGVKTIDRIEPVDFIWQDGPLTDLIPNRLHGTFDGLVASHVGEHFPDLVGFLKSAATLLKPSGTIALALPDKRVCFDFFQPLTTTADLIDAHVQGRTRHQRRTFFNQAAYLTTRDGEVGWLHAGTTAPFHLAHSLAAAQHAYDDASEDPDAPYRDCHAWAFTPKSFELLMLELNLLGHTDWKICAAEPAPGVEFYVWLKRERIMMAEDAVNPLRLSLLTEMVHEAKSAINQLETVRPTAPSTALTPHGSQPGIVAIVPLYNGSQFIEEALNSIFRQTVQPSEVIVVNDGSTDAGAGVAIVERLARTYPIVLLHKANGGQSSARNFGVKQSKAKLIAFLDQDDVWYETHLQELSKPFTTPTWPPIGWVYSNLDEIDEDGFLVSRSYLGTLSTAHPKRHLYECLREDMFVLPSASLIDRDAFNAVGGFDERLSGYEDDDLFLRLFREGYENIYLDQALSKWRIYPGSSSYTFRMARSRAIYARKLLRMFPDDIRRDRYYARDLIIPRFLDHAVREYDIAQKMGKPEAVAETWSEATFLFQHGGNFGSRLLIYALMQYKGALMQGDNKTIKAAWKELSNVAAGLPNRRRRLRTVLDLLRNPVVSKSAFALRHIARPAMLWAFSV